MVSIADSKKVRYGGVAGAAAHVVVEHFRADTSRTRTRTRTRPTSETAYGRESTSTAFVRPNENEAKTVQRRKSVRLN